MEADLTTSRARALQATGASENVKSHKSTALNTAQLWTRNQIPRFMRTPTNLWRLIGRPQFRDQLSEHPPPLRGLWGRRPGAEAAGLDASAPFGGFKRKERRTFRCPVYFESEVRMGP